MGWTVHCACGSVTEEIPHTDEVFALPFEKKITSFKNLKVAGMLRRQVRKQGYDLVIVHTSLAAFFTRLALMGLRRRPRLINMVHGYLFDEDTGPLKHTILLAAERITAPLTDLIITMNQSDDNLVRQHHLCRKIAKIPGVGVDYARLDQQENPELRKTLGIKPDQFVLLYPAEFSLRKSHDILLNAMTELPNSVVLVLPGDGVMREECDNLVESLGIKNRVFFPGYVTDMGAWYKMADCAISSSRSEGLPFNVMEAMHCGLPVIASRVKGHVDLIRHGENGLLFDYDDWVDCADAVKKLFCDREYAKQLGHQASLDAEQYALDKVQEQVMDLYLSVLK